MRNVRIDKEHEFDKEKGAVISELARNEDTPWDLEYKAILPILFGKKHPYGHSVIGVVWLHASFDGADDEFAERCRRNRAKHALSEETKARMQITRAETQGLQRL